MIALNERLPDGYKLLPLTAGHPGPGEGRRRSLRRWWPTVAPPVGTLTRQRRGWPGGWPTASSRPTCTPSGPGWARWASGGWPRRCAPGPATRTRRPAARSPAAHRPSGSATGRTRSATASRGRLQRQLAHLPGARRAGPPGLRLDAAAAAVRGPSPGCRWAATTRSATATARTADLGRSRPPGKPQHRAGACWFS